MPERGVILLNGEPYKGEISAGFTVCCDGALRWAEGRTRIDVKAGDFDSLGYIPAGAEVLPRGKELHRRRDRPRSPSCPRI